MINQPPPASKASTYDFDAPITIPPYIHIPSAVSTHIYPYNLGYPLVLPRTFAAVAATLAPIALLLACHC